MERYFELCEETPFSDEVQKQYNPSNERIQHANYKMDLEIAKLKWSLWITHRNNAKTFDPIWFKINGREEIITFYQDIFDLNDLFNFSDLMVFTHNIPIVSRICAQVKQFCYCSEMTAVSVIIV